MKPIFFTVGENLQVMIIPDTVAHLDGHEVITRTYNVYRNKGLENAGSIEKKESELLLTKKSSPDYMGFITFETPGKLFTYSADGGQVLTSVNVQQVIDNITNYRDNPGLWKK
jgi:hypothetical protein